MFCVKHNVTVAQDTFCSSLAAHKYIDISPVTKHRASVKVPLIQNTMSEILTD